VIKNLRDKWHLWRQLDDALARRVMVENYLINYSKGSKRMSPEIAAQLALHLGVPTDVSKTRSLKQRLTEAGL
jgi:hypothetical protein